MIFLYNLFIRLYVSGIRIASIWNRKAGQWVRGRERLFEDLSSRVSKDDRIIWVHCASAGELEQGKPVIEELRQRYPSYRILVSFFSPSGYNVGKKYPYADYITYLPADTRKNARRFVDIVHPSLVVFIKYEYWYHHLAALAFHHIPVLMVSAIFREDRAFFKWYGRFYRQLLFLFRHLFVQDRQSVQLLAAHGIGHCSVSGDTRFDRVTKIASAFSELELIPIFTAGSKVLVAGSTWPDDEKMLAALMQDSEVKLILAPHEIRNSHIASLQKQFPGAFRYTDIRPLVPGKKDGSSFVWDKINEQQSRDLQKQLEGSRILIIDHIGILSRLYHYADITYVGGGFNKSGIHNTLEAAVWGKPVLFGPNYRKFREAADLVQNGAAFSIGTPQELKTKVDELLNNPGLLETTGNRAGAYVKENTGATERVMAFIQEKRLLTN